MSSPFSEAAPNLQALGFHVLPILPATAAHGGKGKAPGEFSSGLWRGMSKWQNGRDTPPSKFQFDLWMRYPDANIGLVMGSPIGAERLIAIDVDAADFDDLREILCALPYSPMAKRGAKGETRFYRAAKEIKSKPYDRAAVEGGKPSRLVDLLTGFDARQCVVPPSMHPDGMRYAWLEGPVHASDLPLFTADDQAVLEETLASLGWSPDAARRSPRDSSNPFQDRRAHIADPDDFFSETKAAALANMPAWVPALDLYGCRPARGGYEAVATWRASSTGRPIAERKLNLSIQENGIKDWGTSETYSAIDLVMAAHDCDQAAATSWLRSRLGLDSDVIVLEQSVTSEAVERPAFVVDTPVVKQSLTAEDPAPSAEPRVIPDTELPDHLTRPPGLLGVITDWIEATAVSPQRGLALGAALALIGTAAGRKFSGPTLSGTHLYILALAPTGAGKDHPLSMIGSILDASAMGAHSGPSQFMSQTAVVNTLRRKPLCVCAMDEFGAFLRRVNGRKAGGHEQAITGILRSAWGASFKTFQTPAYAEKAEDKIVAPAMSIYGASTPEEFYAAVEGGDLFNGFLNRFLAITTQVNPRPRKPPKDMFDVPGEITAPLVSIYNAGGALLGASMHGITAGKPEIVVPWDHPQAERVFDVLREDIRARPAEGAMLVRTAEMAIRMATIRAIGINHLHPRVTVEDMEWGRDFALWSAERMIVDAGDYMSENEYQSNSLKVLRIIKERGRCSYRVVSQALKFKLKPADILAIIDGLAQAGAITVEKITPATGGLPAAWYTAT